MRYPELLEKRRLLAAIVSHQGFLEDTFEDSSDVYAVYRQTEFRQPGVLELGTRFSGDEPAVLRLEEPSFEAIEPKTIDLPTGYVDAIVLAMNEQRMLLESGEDLLRATDDVVEVLAQDARLIDSEGGFVLADVAGELQLIHETNGQSLVLDGHDAFFEGIDQSGGFLFGDDFEPAAYPIERNPLRLGEPIFVERPEDLPSDLDFFGSYVDAFRSVWIDGQQSISIGVFEYVTVVDEAPILALGLADLETGQVLEQIGESYALGVQAEDGVIAIRTPDDVELMVLRKDLAQDLGIEEGTRVSMRSLLNDPQVDLILGVTDIETNGATSLSIVMDVLSVDGEIGQYVYSLSDPAPWQSPGVIQDVNDNGFVTPVDALLVINYLNRNDGAGPVNIFVQSTHFLDVNGDNFISAIDALLVINELNRQSRYHAAAEGEATVLVPTLQDLEDLKKRRLEQQLTYEMAL